VPIAYVSDEDDIAVPGALLELTGATGTYEARSTASGAVRADIPPGDYAVAVACAGYGAKLTEVRVDAGTSPPRIRLLRDRPYAYVWPKAARAGDRCELRVSSPAGYRAELWHCGAEQRFVAHLGHGEHPPRATAQVIPDGDFCAIGAGWNQVGATLGPGVDASPRLLVAPPRSGLYAVHVYGADGSVVSCPWVVAPARPSAPTAVLASDITWNAYNAFGGRSNYVHAAGLPPAPDVNRRQTLPRYRVRGHEEWGVTTYPPLSFDRPEPENQITPGGRITDPITGRDACALAAAEWRLLGWLEREGYDHDLYAETQFDAGLLDLSHYRVLILNCHPEYWTTRMYDRLKRWVHDTGGRLVYLGGNGLNCAVDLVFPTDPPRPASRHGDATSSAPPTAMTVRNGAAAELAPRRAQVDSRFGLAHEPEARLLGVGYTRAGLLTAAPYEVLDPSHWIFEGTGVRAGDLIGRHTLNTRVPGGASGHETDKVTANSPAGIDVVARGTNPSSGGAEMTTYTTAAGGRVFAAGSINFVTALPIDDVLSRVVRNVLDSFLSGT
jgi:N,N-dimethylformamidase beta subunit-like protein